MTGVWVCPTPLAAYLGLRSSLSDDRLGDLDSRRHAAHHAAATVGSVA
jgi:hypothetical protein